IRPMAEEVGNFTKTGHIGILGTEGTINSGSYLMEIAKFWPSLHVEQEPCPMLVPLVEKGLLSHSATEIFVREYTQKILSRDPRIDTLVLGCTHYPLLQDLFAKILPKNIKILSQGQIIAQKTLEYLANHPEIDARISKNPEKTAKIRFLTTDSVEFFEKNAEFFWNHPIKAEFSTLLQS
ncbi:MAG: hypothetical protein FWH22_03280, partial [Fibromonadales bacterium]|nr:hypothetical protein [Fibromonadales bacterium]